MRTYISAIKGVLAEDDIIVETDSFLLTSLIRACRLQNDQVIIRLPIYKELLHLIIYDIEKHFSQEPYLANLYKAMLLAGYYGLLRAGELAAGPHVLLAKDVYTGKNKNKFLFVLWTSKTHDRGAKPQRIKVSCHKAEVNASKSNEALLYYCPFKSLDNYSKSRPCMRSKTEQFFVYKDRSPVTPEKFRSILKESLDRMNYNSSLYNLHSLRIACCGDLYRWGLSVETIKKIGRWKSNAVFLYLRD